MALAPGVRLGAYEVLGLLGAGGMGEVYRARDIRLNRDVALKVLPEQFAVDADRLARFKREAQILASLSHPNIAAIHGFEETESVHALVLELVDGPTLADRVARGPIPFDEALPLVRQIAEALEAAHEQGIVHRDLKPANIKVREDGTVKVLDFGLAKLADPSGGASQTGGSMFGQSPTMTSPAMTQVGVILGTAAYMSPEQAKGRPADKRSDIWAFGCVLYEMLTGKRAFDGDDVSDMLAAILRAEPDWSRLPADLPPAARKLLHGCLEKDRKARIGDIAVASFLLTEARTLVAASPLSSPATIQRRRRVWGVAIGSLVAGAALAMVVGWSFYRPAANNSVTRFVVLPPAGTRFPQNATGTPMSLSPDGRHLVFTAEEPRTGAALWIRSFDTIEPRRLSDTGGGGAPFWSPDGQFIGFFAEGKLKKTDAAGRSVQILCDAQGGFGGTWNTDGVILFAAGSEPTLFRVTGSGGQPIAVTKLNAAQDERAHRWPQFLADGRRFLYVATSAKTGSAIMVSSLDSSETTRLSETDSRIGVTSSGYLVFGRQGTLLGQRFDARRAAPAGDAVPLAEGIRASPTTGAASFALSNGNVLAFRTTGTTVSEPWWYDRAGRAQSRLGEAAPYLQILLSPDGKQVAAQVTRTAIPEVWLLDAVRGVPSKLTDGAGPIWSPDSRSLAYFVQRQRNEILHRTLGAAAEEPFRPGLTGVTEDWSMDGRQILFLDASDIWALSVEGDAKPVRLTKTSANEDEPQFSPDGRWIAYMSPESGIPEIYMQPFPGPGERTRVSPSGGVQPKWKRDGRELYYLKTDGTLMAVDIRASSTTIEPGVPHPLFQTRLSPSPISDQYAVTADGQRFLVLTPVSDASEAAITVVFNWPAALKN